VPISRSSLNSAPELARKAVQASFFALFARQIDCYEENEPFFMVNSEDELVGK
jgi:hypothetical protein